jgi:hypothetical protein
LDQSNASKIKWEYSLLWQPNNGKLKRS